jgi:LacI family transcriptional regulator
MSRLNGPTRTNRPAKLIDVARHAGVSTGTVSNVLNHPDKVKEGTSARVMRSIEHLGFVRDTNASSLANGGSHDIGLVVIDLANSIFLDAARGAQSTARAAGLNLLMAGSENDFEVQSSNVDSFIGARVAGLLLAPVQDSSAQIQRLTKRHVPVVLVNYDPGTDHACSVIVDNDAAGYIAARHLIDLGRRRIAFVSVDWDLQPVEQRRHGIRRAVAETGGAVTLEEIVAEDLEVGSGNAIARQVADRDAAERPDAVVAVTDNLAVGFIEQAADLGIDVPGDIAVMGTDDNTSAARCRLTLTTVTMQGRQLGSVAMELLMDEIRHGRDEHRHQRVVLTPQLVVQQSTVR